MLISFHMKKWIQVPMILMLWKLITSVIMMKIQKKKQVMLDLGGGWGRIIFPPVQRGKQVHMNICQPTNQDASEGSFEREVK
ncbi:hypothetical protein REPUB_Repub08aG0161000 [Reevesia pubescens]